MNNDLREIVINYKKIVLFKNSTFKKLRVDV